MEVTFAYFFWILSTIQVKLGQILVYLIGSISSMFWINAGDWKLVADSLTILIKWQYKEICQFLAIDIYHF